MMKIKVVSVKNLPTRLPILTTIVVWLLLDRLKPQGWVWGVVGTLMVIIWIIALLHVFLLEEMVELEELSEESKFDIRGR